MVPGSNEADAILARAVVGLLRRLAGQVQVHPGGNRRVDVTLPATGAPADPADHLLAVHQQRLTPQHFLNPPGKIARSHRFSQ
ncbi:hypothetical protein D3C79_971720 [compost metagenome]